MKEKWNKPRPHLEPVGRFDGPGEGTPGRTLHVDLNPAIDAAAYAKKGIHAALRALRSVLLWALGVVKSLLRFLRPWLWRAAFASLLIAAVGLAVAVQVEYDGDWGELYEQMQREFRSALREIKKELT